MLISFSFRLERPVLARLRRRWRAHENAGRRCLQLTVAARAEPRPPTIRLTAAPENVGARPSAPSDPEIISLRSNGLPAAGRCRGPSPAGYRRTRPHQVLEIQCRDRCGRCGRKWRPPFWCSGIAACLNDAVHRCQRILNQLTLDNGPRRAEAVEWVGCECFLHRRSRRREAAV